MQAEPFGGAEHCALLLAGWSTTGTRGVYERGGRRAAGEGSEGR